MISEFVEYVKQAWKNKPNVSSPLNADRLNHMESGIENNSKKIKETVTAVNELTEKSTITPTPITGLEFSPATFFTKAGVAYLNIQLSNRTTSPISMENGKVLASGFPIPYKKQQVYTEAIPWNNGFLGSDAKTTTLRLCINGSGQLCSYFPSKNEQISVGMPICINMAYPVEE